MSNPQPLESGDGRSRLGDYSLKNEWSGEQLIAVVGGDERRHSQACHGRATWWRGAVAPGNGGSLIPQQVVVRQSRRWAP